MWGQSVAPFKKNPCAANKPDNWRWLYSILFSEDYAFAWATEEVSISDNFANVSNASGTLRTNTSKT